MRPLPSRHPAGASIFRPSRRAFCPPRGAGEFPAQIRFILPAAARSLAQGPLGRLALLPEGGKKRLALRGGRVLADSGLPPREGHAQGGKLARERVG